MSSDDYLERVVYGPPFLPGEELKYELVRLGTYKEWPSWARVLPVTLAPEGFYYTGQSDVVSCFACQTEVGQWELGQDPSELHHSLAPSCPMVLGQSNNVPNTPLTGSFVAASSALADLPATALREASGLGRTFTSRGTSPPTELISRMTRWPPTSAAGGATINQRKYKKV